MSNFINLVSGESTVHDKIKNLKMKRISTHTQTLNAIKAATIHKRYAGYMFYDYITTPNEAKKILKSWGKPNYMYGDDFFEKLTIKLHNIL